MACRAIEFCNSGQWGQAILPLLQACMEPAQWSYHALLARTLAQLGHNDLAVAFLQQALRRQPDHLQLRMVYWQVAPKVLTRAQLQHEARVFLPEPADPAELKLLHAILGEASATNYAKHESAPLACDSAVTAQTILPNPLPSSPKVDILVPVYGGYQHTRRCLESLIEAHAHNTTPSTLIVLDDAGSDHALAAYLKQLAEAGQIQLHRHPQNLGFINNINYGMRLNPGRDVAWLNSDTLVHGNWLDRLNAAAYSQPKVASVTPWSNNGELLSFTESQISSSMLNRNELAQIDDIANRQDLPPVPIPGGCGFCFYVPRAALNDVGYLNNNDLKRGYGEETEWSMRARQKGWIHLAATNTLVAHEGGNSFGLEKALRVYQNNLWIQQTYPDIDNWFETHPGKKDLNAARQQLQAARLPDLIDWARIQKPALEVMPEFLSSLFPVKDNPKPRIRLSYAQKPESLTIVLQAPLTPGWRMQFELPSQSKEFQSIFDAINAVVAQTQLYESVDQMPINLREHIQVPVTKTRPIKPTDIKQLTGKTWLIADSLKDPARLEQWLALVRQFGRDNLSASARQTLFCFLEPGEHAHALRATGAAYQLPRLEGLPIPEQVKLANIQGALSLEQDEKERTYSYALAECCKITLAVLEPIAVAS